MLRPAAARIHHPAAAPRVRAGGRPRGTRGYLAAIVVVAACGASSILGRRVIDAQVFVTLFPLAVLIVAAAFGPGPAVPTAIGGILVFDFVFLPPFLAFAVPGLRDGLTLVVMSAVAITVTSVAEQLRRRGHEAREQANLEALRNALLSGLSHDLRTPMTALVGASEALCDERLGVDQRRAYSLMVAEEARRVHRLIRSLLELTRLGPRRARKRHVAEAIDEVIGSALRRLRIDLAGRQVVTSVPEAIPLVPFDPVLIEQVIVNLIENVIRHAGPASPVEILVREQGDDIRVEIGDRGPGVGRGEEELVFEPLYRGRTAVQRPDGNGLGLALCRAIVTAHEGRIELTNRPGGGAVVAFTLPRGVPRGSRRGLLVRQGNSDASREWVHEPRDALP